MTRGTVCVQPSCASISTVSSTLVTSFCLMFLNIGPTDPIGLSYAWGRQRKNKNSDRYNGRCPFKAGS